MKSKDTIFLWFDKDALDAARFYAATFPNSEVTAVHKAPADCPSGKAGDVLIVEFTVLGIPCLGLNGGPAFRHSEAFSFQIATDDQAETDRTGTRSFATADRKALAVGARIAGVYPGRSLHAHWPMPLRRVALRQNAHSRQ